jgi:hypothetical protein
MVDGIDGTNGTDGVDGVTGAQGIQGVTGADGQDGVDGTDGTNGTDGVDGVTGAQGIQGVTGADGQDGVDGTDGINGTDGVDGVTGAQGIQGVTGADGQNGADGTDGTNGTDGVDGVTGAQGIQGATGPLVNGVNGQTLRNNGSSWIANSLLFNNGTNIGIGTVNPLANLHLDGGRFILTTDHSSLDSYLNLNHLNQDFRIQTSGSTIASFKGDQNIFLGVQPNSYVGVGVPITSSLTNKLHVDGSMRLTENFYDKNNSSGSVGEVLSATINGTEWVDPNSLISSSGSGTDDQNIQGSSFDSNSSQLTIGIEGGNSQTVDLSSLNSGSGADNDWVFDQASSYVYNITDKIGIGTLNPLRKLHVVADDVSNTIPSVTIENSVDNEDAEPTIHFKNNYSVSPSNFTIGINNTVGNGAFQISNTTGLNTGYPSIHIDPIQGYLGIGTSSPSTQLDVFGGGSFYLGNLELTFGDFNTSFADINMSFGNINAPGGIITASVKNFLIDHPSYPLEKTLRHYSIESNEGLVIYRGKVLLDSNGESKINLPDYFYDLVDENKTTVNLTPIGKAPFLVSYEFINNNIIIYGEANKNVSYQVLAERDDPGYNLRKGSVIELKDDESIVPKGGYLDPEAYGLKPNKETYLKSKKLND